MTRLSATLVALSIILFTVHWLEAQTMLHCSFDGNLKDASGIEPLRADAVSFVDGNVGKAAIINRPALLAYPTKGFNSESFTISLRVKHEKPLRDYFYRRLTYFYHETPDMKNRIGILKRDGANYFVFFMSNSEGRAKGRDFGGDWFSMSTAPFDWEANTWHEFVCTADKKAGKAQFFVDGKKVAEATGTQFPEKLGEAFWVGSEQGHSWMRGAMDELRIESVAHLKDGPVERPWSAAIPLPLARPVMEQSVGKASGKEFTINLDFFDICIGTDTWDMRDCDGEMERLMAMCAHYGVDRVFFRVSVCGVDCYHTEVMTPAYEDAFKQYEGKDMIDGCCASIPSQIPRMAAVMRRIDPMASCAKYAHKHGMQVYAWVTIFDSLYYATEKEFFQRHPEYTWVSKDGAKHIPGVPCYAYPEVRKYRLDQMKELVEYDIDGIILCPRSHSPWPGRNAGGGNDGSRGYGFNEPVVKEFIRRYGTDPREAKPDSLEELRFVQLKSDFLTSWLREVKDLTSQRGKKLAINTNTTYSDPVLANWMYLDADTLARERIVDELCLMSRTNHDLNHWRVLADGKIKVTTWAAIHGKTYEECLNRMRAEFPAMLTNPTSDGSTYHELANLIYPDCWEEAIVDALKEWQNAKTGKQ
ncbi:MAG: LamG-like jellyroll fold domain-containing protein [Planctomycetota bacterium]